MFGKNFPGAFQNEVRLEPESSEERYGLRIQRFKQDGKRFPRLRHSAFWILHNCVAHPALGLRPSPATAKFHALTSDWLNCEKTIRFLGLPKDIPNKKAWIYHNLVAHMAIGLFPTRKAFEIHDKSAEEMNVPGWV